LFSRKSNQNFAVQSKVIVEFIIINGTDKIEELTEEEISCLETSAKGIRLAARIVDTPCNEMNVTNFIEVKN